MVEVVIGLTGAIALQAIYATLKVSWPESYGTLSGSLEVFTEKRLLNYLAFRALPVYVLGVFVAVTALNAGGNRLTAVATLGGVHALATHGRVLVSSMTQGATGRRPILALFHALLILLVLGASAVAYFSAPALVAFIPALADVVVAFWTALLTAAAVTLSQGLFRQGVDVDGLISRARRDVGERNLMLIREYAHEAQTDPDLIEAVVLAEALQRPRWLRRIEYVKSWLVRPGSYGVAQVHASSRISDEQSIALLTQAFQGYFPPIGKYGVDRERLSARIELHNNSAALVGLVIDIFTSERRYTSASSKRRAIDGRPVIEVTDPARRGQQWLVTGTYWGTFHELIGLVQNTDALDHVQIHLEGREDARGSWQLLVPLNARSLIACAPQIPVGELHRLHAAGDSAEGPASVSDAVPEAFENLDVVKVVIG